MKKRTSHAAAAHHHIEHRHRAAAGALFVMLFFAVSGSLFWLRATPAASHEARVVDITSFRLEIADTDARRTQGLSGHAPLATEEGMLFAFSEAGVYPFWMKDMLFPLDIIWLRDGRVVDIATLQPPTDGSLVPETHVPHAKADQVLEINAGRAKQLGIEEGVRLLLP
jgi:uncharacterized membrane protein (UPF0127 family)